MNLCDVDFLFVLYSIRLFCVQLRFVANRSLFALAISKCRLRVSHTINLFSFLFPSVATHLRPRAISAAHEENNVSGGGLLLFYVGFDCLLVCFWRHIVSIVVVCRPTSNPKTYLCMIWFVFGVSNRVNH